ncbi:MAG TPA: YbaK/EbsC family protein [Gaiellaceae bacterium]|nr:YbaK/EbsC family protein [Gaiellaceae bacterium]
MGSDLWPDPVERVSAILREAGAEARVEEFAAGTPTAEDAARAVGCQLAEIVKSILFDCDGRAVLAMVPGDRRADATKVAAAAGAARAKVASPARVEEATGYALGAVAPFSLRAVEQVFIDRRLLVDGLLWVGGGSTRHMVGLPAGELVRIAQARAVDVAGDA